MNEYIINFFADTSSCFINKFTDFIMKIKLIRRQMIIPTIEKFKFDSNKKKGKIETVINKIDETIDTITDFDPFSPPIIILNPALL